MNTHNSIGFENNEPVLTVDFDYASLNGYDDDTTDDIEAALERQRSRLIREFSDAQVKWIEWTFERVPACSLSQERQVRLKLAILLLNIRPAALGLGRRATLTKLAEKEHVTKQKLSQINTALSDRFPFISNVMKSVTVRKRLGARFAGSSKKKSVKSDAPSSKGTSPFSIPPPPKSYARNEQMLLF